MLINLNEYQEPIYINFGNFDGVSPTSGNRGNTTYKIYVWYELDKISTTSINHKMNINHKSITSQHSSSHITNQIQVQITNPCETIDHKHAMQ